MAVTPDKIAVALGEAAPDPTSIKAAQWQLWIDDAAMLIETRRAQLGAAEPDEAKLDYVIREAVVAQVKRPDDATQVTVSLDDASSSKTYRSGKGRVSVIDEWWSLLGLTDSNGAYSLDMIPSASRHLPWCSLSMGATICSCGTDIAGRPIYETDESWT